MVNDTPTNVLKVGRLQARLFIPPINTEVMSDTIYEDTHGEGRNSAAVLRENDTIEDADDAVSATHKRVSALRYLVNIHGFFTGTISEQAQKAIRLINNCYRDWEKLPDNVLQQTAVALCNAKYPELTVSLCNEVISRGFVNDEATEQFARNLYGSLMNFTDSSEQFREAVANAGMIELLITYLTDSDKVKADTADNQKREDFLRYSIGILHNLAKNPELKYKFLSLNATKVLGNYLDYRDDYVQCISLLSLVQVLSETPEVNGWVTQKGFIDSLVDYCHSALMSTDHRCRGMHAEELAEGLCLLAVNKQFKEKLVQNAQIISILKNLLKSLDNTFVEQTRGVDLAWQLSFTENGKTKIQQECFSLLKELASGRAGANETAATNLKKNAQKTVSYIENWDMLNPKENIDDGDQQTTSGPTEQVARPLKSSNPGSCHIFLSYCHRQKELVHRVYERLSAKGLNLWVDFKDMSTQWINDMATGIENASVVVIFYSEAYKRSVNCQAEAEYAFTRKRKIFAVKAEPNYQPDGWLGIIVNRLLWVDMSATPVGEEAFDRLFKELSYASQTNTSPGEYPLHAAGISKRATCCTLS